jgi:hypothetical protein
VFRLPLLAALGLLATAAPALAAPKDTAPAVARPSFVLDGQTVSRGTVFFVPANTRTGAAAVGTAHTFDLSKLVRAESGQFVLGNTKSVVGRTSGFLVAPGRPFTLPGATLFDDYIVYALEGPPAGVRVLDFETGVVEPGMRVRILGIPDGAAHDEDDLYGRVVEASPSRIEVDLDVVPENLAGWGGAPVLARKTDRVIGMLQAYWPTERKARVSISPITAVRAALLSPLDGGLGRPFARFEKHAASVARAARQKAGADAPSHRFEAPSGPLIPSGATDGTQVHLAVEYPPGQHSVVGDQSCGLYVSGRALALHGELRHFDVILVIDTSRSTIDPTGADINGNGIVGKPYLGRIGSIFDVGSTDPGDSILAAEVAAARQLLRGLDPRSTRVGLVTFAGEHPQSGGGLFGRASRRPAITLEPLTSEYARIEHALDQVLAREPDGSTHMAAGVDQATIELMGLRGALSTVNPRAEKLVLFFTDGQPTLPHGPGFEADNVRAVLRAAGRADRADIRIHSFAIGPDALDGPIATVEMAARTDGYFTPVRHPGDLVEVIEEVSFANLSGVRLHSITTGEPASPFRATADGSWGGFVKMEPGKNVIEVSATATDGASRSAQLEVFMEPGGPSPPIPPELVAQRNWLLEECLREIKRVRMSAERERAEQLRKELLVEIQQERDKARRRAAEQRKRLQLEVEEEPQ